MADIVNKGGDPNRRAALEFNERARKQRRTFATPDHSGHVAFNCPELDYWYHVTFTDPELGASDPVVARKAWLKFLNTDAGRPYKLNPYEGRKAHRVPLLSR